MIIDLRNSLNLFTIGVTPKASRLSLEENQVKARVSRIIEKLPTVIQGLPGEYKNSGNVLLGASPSEANTVFLRSSEGTLRVQKIYGDGNCMFRAISYILWGNEDEHRALRTHVASHIRNHWWEYEPFVIAEWNITNPAEYASFMSRDGVFATELECTVATKLYEMNLSIYRKIAGGHGSLDVRRVFHNIVNNGYATARLLFSGRSESGHYDVLFLEE